MAAEYEISNYTRYKSASKFAAGPLHFSEERKTRMSDRDQSKGDLICGGFEGKEEKYKKGSMGEREQETCCEKDAQTRERKGRRERKEVKSPGRGRTR